MECVRLGVISSVSKLLKCVALRGDCCVVEIFDWMTGCYMFKSNSRFNMVPSEDGMIIKGFDVGLEIVVFFG